MTQPCIPRIIPSSPPTPFKRNFRENRYTTNCQCARKSDSWWNYIAYEFITAELFTMESPSKVCVCTFDFTELPKCMRITRSSECFDEGTKTTQVSIDVSCESTDPDLLLAFAQMPSWKISLPGMFFSQNIERNIKGLLALLQPCLLSQSGFERSCSNIQDDPTTKSAIPHGSNDTKGYK